MIPDVLLRGEVAHQGRRAREGRWRRRRRAVGTAGGPREGSVPAPGDGQGPVRERIPGQSVRLTQTPPWYFFYSATAETCLFMK